MEIHQEKENNLNIISLKGRLDATTSGTLENTFNALINAGDVQILIDCAGLEYISSAGLRVLLASAKTVKKHEGLISLTTLNTNVKQVFEISGFTNIFPIYTDKAEALKAL